MVIDMHTHILPHMDDGAKDADMTRQMLQKSYAEGTEMVIATPHFCHGMDRKRWEAKRQTAWEAACSIAKEIHPDFRIVLGAEVYMESGIRKDLEAGVPLTMHHSRIILIEFSPGANYMYIKNSVMMLQSMGYEPILAHVERYQALIQQERVKELSRMGVKIQANTTSILGHSGRKVKRYVMQLLKQELIDMVSSDAHDMKYRAPGMKKCMKYLNRKLDASYCRQIFGENMRQLFISSV